MDRRIVLVTGASRGIGRACAVAFGRTGAHVVVNFLGNTAAAEETLRLVTEAGGEGVLRPFDVADPEAVTRCVDELATTHGRLDVVVNNAALAVDALLVRQKQDDWDRQLAVNLTGPMLTSRAASKLMMKQRRGAIVNVVSVVGEMGNAGQSAYAATKAGLIGLTKSLARELASRNVRVNAVSPGFIETDMTAGLDEKQRAGALERVPMGRLGSADEVAAAVAFLASDAASYITGEVLRVNGGLLT